MRERRTKKKKKRLKFKCFESLVPVKRVERAGRKVLDSVVHQKIDQEKRFGSEVGSEIK